MKCENCKTYMKLKVCQSAAGYYVGYCCNNCGPYERTSGYFETWVEAEQELLYENTFDRGGCNGA